MSVLGRISAAARTHVVGAHAVAGAKGCQTRWASFLGPTRTGTAATQLLKADIPPLEDPLLHFFSSLIMRHGRRHKASKQVSLMLAHVHALSGAQPMELFRAAVLRAAPSVKVISLKKGMKVTMHPVPLSERQRVRQALLWIMRASMYQAGSRLSERLAKEVIGINQGKSQALSWKEQQHQQAMVNRAVVRQPPAWAR